MNEATSAGGRCPEHLACRPRGGWGFAESGRQAVSGRPAKRKRVEACSFVLPNERNLTALQGDTTPGLGTLAEGLRSAPTASQVAASSLTLPSHRVGTRAGNKLSCWICPSQLEPSGGLWSHPESDPNLPRGPGTRRPVSCPSPPPPPPLPSPQPGLWWPHCSHGDILPPGPQSFLVGQGSAPIAPAAISPPSAVRGLRGPGAAWPSREVVGAHPQRTMWSVGWTLLPLGHRSPDTASPPAD